MADTVAYIIMTTLFVLILYSARAGQNYCGLIVVPPNKTRFGSKEEAQVSMDR